MGGKSSSKQGVKEKSVANNEVGVYATKCVYNSSLQLLIFTQELI